MSMNDLEALSALWERQWPSPAWDVQLRSACQDRWVRFHSLPGSKRYPGDEAEYAIVLERHHTLLNELGPNDDELYVVTHEWTGDPEPVVRMSRLQEVDPGGRHWSSHVHDDEFPDDVVYEHRYISRRPRRREALDPLLRLVADDVVAEVGLAPLDLRWLYHPYDGGGDVFAPNRAVRDALKAAHPDWLSAHPTGL